MSMAKRREASSLKPSSFYILLALAEGPRHGYGILRDVEEQTDGSVRLWPVTLYGSLEKLVASELIEELGPGARPPGESEKRRYYQLTRKGRVALDDESGRLRALARLAQTRLRKAT